MADRVFELIDAGDVAGLRALLASNPAAAASRRADGTSAVLWARYNFELDAVEALLEANPALDAFEAAAIGRTDALRAELERDPAVATAFAPDGFTALGLASFFGHLEAAQVLIAAGARVNDASRNAMRVAPLHSALAGGHVEIATLLLEAGADVNAVQADGYTPLHEAAQNGDQPMAEQLVAAGANPRARLDDGSTPAESARRAGHDSLAAWLEELEALEK
ncbi:MAG TPA: ankyrin repeat domain-containing protein [Candidatus Limnocylindria bacterium]|nr:ankyrin repeat domain-containing protein [Candidatus Limnocylindria bacterium]